MNTITRIGALLLVFASWVNIAMAQAFKLVSPNKKMELSLSSKTDSPGSWLLTVKYMDDERYETIIPSIGLGLMGNGLTFSDHLSLLKAEKNVEIRETYTAVHGKRKDRENRATECTFHFINRDNKKIDIVLRAYNDGIAFRYTLPGKPGERRTITDELTSYQIKEESSRWLQPFVTSYEDFYSNQDKGIEKGQWGYPGLFKVPVNGTACWMLISEAGIDSSYCATKLSNLAEANHYKLMFPNATDGNSVGSVYPTVSLPWVSPWRVVTIGTLSDLVQSTLIEDVSPASKIEDTSWIKPGKSSWVYWANNHGTMDYQKLTQYVDLAARMGWPYTLFDWEWDQMGNGGKLEDAVRYATSKGVKPMMWYNSGGPHNTVTSTPRDRMFTHESRMKEFAWLKSIGVFGVKIDFFESDKQNMIKYYIDILEDAAQFRLMVNFHGSTVPRGWSRTYPHLMSMEAVYGAEWYNYTPDLLLKGASHNATLPFTRNVIGPMDYTPVTFTNSQYPHSTTFAHELALSVIFESGIQHMADRPEGFDHLPDAPKAFLRQVPTGWDDTRFLDGYPGKNITVARRHGTDWYVAGINGLDQGASFNVPLTFLKQDKQYKVVLIEDGEYDTDFHTQYFNFSSKDLVHVKWLPRGGFVAVLQEIQ